MSQFFAYAQPEYIRKLRKFLGRSHPVVRLLKREGRTGAKGRAPNHSEAIIRLLEKAVNELAIRCEAPDSTFQERFFIASRYAGIKDVQLAKLLGVSRQAVSGWRTGVSMPSRLDALATALDVPVVWLQRGGKDFLPPNSHVGVRVGCEARTCRERLLALSQGVVSRQIDNWSTTSKLNAAIDALISSDNELGHLARQAGGRWLIHDGNLVFVPWQPIEAHGLSRRDWSDAVERLIESALVDHHSVYAAFRQIKQQCEALGEDYPKIVTLYKRVSRQREREAKFGLNQQQVAELETEDI